jgi:hypothetical protein
MTHPPNKVFISVVMVVTFLFWNVASAEDISDRGYMDGHYGSFLKKYPPYTQNGRDDPITTQSEEGIIETLSRIGMRAAQHRSSPSEDSNDYSTLSMYYRSVGNLVDAKSNTLKALHENLNNAGAKQDLEVIALQSAAVEKFLLKPEQQFYQTVLKIQESNIHKDKLGNDVDAAMGQSGRLFATLREIAIGSLRLYVIRGREKGQLHLGPQIFEKWGGKLIGEWLVYLRNLERERGITSWELMIRLRHY